MNLAFEHVISADSHVIEPRDIWFKALGAKHGDRTPRNIDSFNGVKGRYFYTGRQTLKIGEFDDEQEKQGTHRAGFIPEVRVDFQKKAGIDAELLNSTLMLLLMQGEHADVVRDCASVFNDWLMEFVAYDPKRLIGVSMIPMHDVAWATRELERTAKRGLRGAVINTLAPEGCPPYRNAVYDPFWAKASELGVPITLHIVAGRIPDPLHFHTRAEQEDAPVYFLRLFAEAAESLANDFIFGQVLDRFPQLKLMCSEFEVSWIPHFMWRLDQMQSAFSAGLPLPTLKMKASDYMRHRVWHGMINDPFGQEVIDHIGGANRVMWGSDFPHIRSIGLEARETLAKLFDHMPRQEQAKVVAGNVAALYGVPLC